MNFSLATKETRRRASQSEADMPRIPGRVSRQQSLPRMHGTATLHNSVSMTEPHSGAPKYVKQCHLLIERQKEAFNEERALWNMERQELHERLAHLEAILLKLRSADVEGGASEPAAAASQADASAPVWDPSRQSSLSSNGDEIWRGSKPDSTPSRTFSDASGQTFKPGEKLPSIAEGSGHNSVRKVSLNTTAETIPKPVTYGAIIDKNLDGIHFKTSGLGSNILRAVTSDSPSPLRSPSPSVVSPRTNGLRASKSMNFDPSKLHAGHTPLARHTYPGLDGGLSLESTTTDTPIIPEQERPPLEPHASAIKQPSERRDSYFPVVAVAAKADQDSVVQDDPNNEESQSLEDVNDPALKGPLSLPSHPSQGDDKFLAELDEKLRSASEEMISPPPKKKEDHDHNDDLDKKESKEEVMPGLRIKRSMNFGAPLGANNRRGNAAGRGF